MNQFFTRALSALATVVILSHALLADDKDPAQPDVSDGQTAATADDVDQADADAATDAADQPTEATDPGAGEPAKSDAPATVDAPAKADEATTSSDAEKKTEDPAATQTPPAEPKEPPAATTDSTSAEDTTKSADPAVDQELESWQVLHQQWLDLDQRLRDAEREYYILSSRQDLATKEQQFQLRLAYEELIKNEANPLLMKLRGEVIAAYKAKPNQDVQLVRLLVGFMVNHARMQEEADAKEIVELLIENKADAKYVLVDARMTAMRPTSAEILERMQKRYKDALAPEETDAPEKTDGDVDETSDARGDEKPATANADKTSADAVKSADPAKTGD